MACRALLFSSDANAAAILRAGLAEIDLQVDECREPAAAIQHLANSIYSAVVIDTPERPVRDGVLRQLRCSPLNKETVVIVTISAESIASHAFSEGANFVLHRPIDEEGTRVSLRAVNAVIQRDKRRARRTPVFADANISFPSVESAKVRLLDLSEHGLSLQFERDLPPQRKIYFRFTLPGQVKSIQLSGETTWQDSGGRVGIRFVDVPQTARRLMKEWLELRLSLEESKVRIEIGKGEALPAAAYATDRRNESRHACRLGVDIYRAGKDAPHRCMLTDLGTGGCYVEMPSTFAIGTKIKLVVRAQDIKFVSAGSVRSENRAFGMGIAFETLTPEQAELLQKLIAMASEEKEADADEVVKDLSLSD